MLCCLEVTSVAVELEIYVKENMCQIFNRDIDGSTDRVINEES